MFTKLFFSVWARLNNVAKDERGVTAIEYAIIGVAISAIVLALFSSGTLEDAISSAMDTITSNITDANSTTN
ncbi:Flp family type IVb pilin [Vibrio sp. SCSIO 43136]|uniref:Flp family type IVb pilin n=1 Tax=Vibrio sp. SCSIO 43136 TaxID=2819101 RepID=UPI002074FE4B|nr:Flp family type IVb pilin [Vibrio sp. SCSIO 43136]USD66703.1 Flp family type IVb pilin [Vibrio sp. SCSIO 43136]